MGVGEEGEGASLVLLVLVTVVALKRKTQVLKCVSNSDFKIYNLTVDSVMCGTVGFVFL